MQMALSKANKVDLCFSAAFSYKNGVQVWKNNKWNFDIKVHFSKAETSENTVKPVSHWQMHECAFGPDLKDEMMDITHSSCIFQMEITEMLKAARSKKNQPLSLLCKS